MCGELASLLGTVPTGIWYLLAGWIAVVLSYLLGFLFVFLLVLSLGVLDTTRTVYINYIHIRHRFTS